MKITKLFAVYGSKEEATPAYFTVFDTETRKTEVEDYDKIKSKATNEEINNMIEKSNFSDYNFV